MDELLEAVCTGRNALAWNLPPGFGSEDIKNLCGIYVWVFWASAETARRVAQEVLDTRGQYAYKPGSGSPESHCELAKAVLALCPKEGRVPFRCARARVLAARRGMFTCTCARSTVPYGRRLNCCALAPGTRA